MSDDNNAPPKLGEICYYYDENKHPHAAIVAHIHARITHDRPVLNLAVFNHEGKVANRQNIEPAHHNGTIWVMMNKWSWPDEIPTDEWSHLPPPVVRRRRVGAGEFLSVASPRR